MPGSVYGEKTRAIVSGAGGHNDEEASLAFLEVADN